MSILSDRRRLLRGAAAFAAAGWPSHAGAQRLLGPVSRAGETGTIAYATRAEIANLAPASVAAALLTEFARSGLFVWRSGNLSSMIARDPRQAVYIAPVSDTTGASGAWVRQYDGFLNIKWFGADLTGATSAVQAFRDVITFAGETALTCFCPKGIYLIDHTVAVTAGVRFLGEGAGASSSVLGEVTLIKVPASVTAFVPQRGGTGTNNGDEAMFEGLTFEALAKNTTETTGSMAENTTILTLASAADFTNGQFIEIEGMVPEVFLKNPNYMLGSTTAGSLTIKTNRPHGCYVGMEVWVVGAGFPAGAKVVSVTSTTITMSDNASTTVTGAAIKYSAPAVAMIMSGGGTAKVEINYLAERAVNSATVRHADGAIHGLTRYNVSRCAAFDFVGPGFAISAGNRVSQPSGVATNANCCNWSDCFVKGNGHGIAAQGTDGNASHFLQMEMLNSDRYSVLDTSMHGNYWPGLHVSGPYGVMHVRIVSHSTFHDEYTEGGVESTYGERAMGMGGTASSVINGGLRITPASGAANLPTVELFPNEDTQLRIMFADKYKSNGLFYVDNSGRGGSADMRWFLYESGAWLFRDHSNNRVSVAFTDAGHGLGAGHALFQRGIWLGNDAQNMAAGNFRNHRYVSAPPATVEAKGTILWNNGDNAAHDGVDYWRSNGTAWVARP